MEGGGPENPALFSKTLRKSHVQHVPTRLLSLLPVRNGQRVAQFQVRYGDEADLRTFRYVQRRGSYPKPAIVKGRSHVVRDKRLRVGDVLKFYAKQQEEGELIKRLGVWNPVV